MRKVPRAWLCLVGFLAAALPAPANAQVRDTKGNRLTPTQLSLVPDKNTGQPRLVWLAHEGLRPLEMPGPLGGPNGNKAARWNRPTRFMSEFYYALTENVDRRTYYLLVTSNRDGTAVDEVVGWVDERALVKKNEALIDKDTFIIRKGMIVDKLPDPGRGAKVAVAQDAPVLRLAPTPDGPLGASQPKLFRPFFIYAETPEKDYFLLGLRPRFEIFPDPDEPKKIILGWVPKERICQWDTREAFEWADYNAAAPRRVPGRIYRTAEAASQPTEGANGPSLFGKEPDNPSASGTFGQDWPVEKMRNPMLNWDATKETVTRKRGDNELYHVGVIGRFAGNPNLDPDTMRGKIESVTAQAGTVELLFVIDETESMVHHFGTVAELVRRFIETVSQIQGATMKVGVAYYGDDEAGGRLALPAPLVDIGRNAAAATAIVNEVRAHGVQPGGSQLERVFYGIREAIKGSRFSSFSRKMVIVLGDAGDRHVPRDPSTEDIARLLVKPGTAEIPIEFYALQVCDPDLPENRGFGPAFRQEMRTIVARADQLLTSKYAELTARSGVKRSVGSLSDYQSVPVQLDNFGREVIRQQDDNPIVKVVEKQYGELLRDSRSQSLNLNKFGQGIDTILTPEYQKVLIDEYGIDPEELKKLEGRQSFTYGYVWDNNDRDQLQLRRRMLINEVELKEFWKLVGPLTTQIGKVNKDPDQFIKTVILNIAGQGDPATLKKTSMEDVITMKTGLHPRPGSLLTKKIGELESGKFGGPYRLSELHEIRYHLLNLEDVMTGLAHEYEEREVNQGGLHYKIYVQLDKTRDRPRWFHLDGDPQGMKWYWVDLAQEWP